MSRKGNVGNPNGRPKGKVKNRNVKSDGSTGRKYKSGVIDKFSITKEWDTTFRGKTLDPELVDYYINNDLDLTELYDKMRDYKEE